ncbi:MAG: hypothetical protein NWF14_09185 [Candidatus Bathyarchaeota archaeon]|nr:hypothetical protein [Candidatus Bathyarchaeota archaeon]
MTIPQERVQLNPFLVFPSKTRKYAHITAKQAYESIIHLMRKNLDAKNIEERKDATLAVKAKLGGTIGVKVNIQVIPEDDLSVLDIGFSYRNFLFATFAVLVIVIGLSLVYQTPLPGVGAALILPVAYTVNFTVVRFLDTLNKVLPYLEQEFARRSLMEDRERWQSQPKNTEDLYRRLHEKHVRTWGNINILEYKIAEYQAQGLTRNEAIRKAAEEEGVS